MRKYKDKFNSDFCTKKQIELKIVMNRYEWTIVLCNKIY